VKKYLTIAEAAPAVGMTEKALRQRIFRGQFPHRRWGRRVIIPVAELESFLAGLPGKTDVEALTAVEERGPWG
jgi:hypothetical protein